MIKLLFILLSTLSLTGNTNPDAKIYFNENYGTVMSLDEFKRAQKEGQIKSLDICHDTIKVALKGIKIRVPEISEYRRCYSANLSVNEEKTAYRKDEIPTHVPKTTQYNLTDSCFYLTFGLSPKFQTQGKKMDISIFLFCDTIPCAGERIPIIPTSFDEDNPIKEWSRDIGRVAIMQIGYFPKATDILPQYYLTESTRDKRIILSTTETSGEIEILSVKRAKHPDQLEMKLRLNADASLNHRDIDIPLHIKNGRIDLYQIENADIVPCFFEIDHIWPDPFIPANSFD